jgi:hypothetical protein
MARSTGNPSTMRAASPYLSHVVPEYGGGSTDVRGVVRRNAPAIRPHLLHLRPCAEKRQGGSSRRLHVRAHLSRDQLKMITEAVATGALGYSSERCPPREKVRGGWGSTCTNLRCL